MKGDIETPAGLAKPVLRLPKGPRDRWRIRRLDMEMREVKSHPRVNKPRRWEWVGFVLKVAYSVLRLFGLVKWVGRRALELEVNRLELCFPNLPPSFDGFTILHLTDPHFDMIPGCEEAIRAFIPEETVDLVVITGDYRRRTEGPHEQVVEPMKRLCSAFHAREGILATLGNHDTANMVPDFEALGIRVLLNESLKLRRADEHITLTGLDDVHYYYTEHAVEALSGSGQGFKIALVHSNEVAAEAAEHGYSLYLNGHTHGGQVCLPNGVPVLTHTDTPRSLARGLWQVGHLTGYSNRGCGVIGVPVRTFCRGEIAILTLRRGELGAR